MLADLLDSDELDAPLPFDLPDEMLHQPLAPGERWTKRRLVEGNLVKYELFRRTGALPAAGDRHLVEFFSGFLTEEAEWGKRWNVALTDIETRERGEAGYVAELEKMLASDEVSDMPSGEMVHTVINCLMTGKETGAFAHLPLNIPNAGQCADIPNGPVVEAMCVVDGDGIRGRDVASAPPLLAEFIRRVSAMQELVVDAAVSGDRDKAFAAMMADPLAGRIDYDLLRQMTDELIDATKEWLPQFV
jgi:alpha-galactosidase